MNECILKAVECDIRVAVPNAFGNDIDKNNCLFELIMICSRPIKLSLKGGQPWAPPPRGQAQGDVSPLTAHLQHQKLPPI